jgi:phosphatidylinositol 4-kinase
MIEELSALVLPIDALMSHDNFKPHQQTSSELFSLFRNMWFVCVLFRFTCDERPSTMNEWQAAALTRISIKTPPLVPEDAQDYVTSELEYNTALRKDYIHTVTPSVTPCILPVLSTLSFRQSANIELISQD